MKKETLLTVAVIALLLLNFGILGFLLLRRSGPPEAGGRRKLDRQIVETLQLTSTQQQQFDQLKSAHHALMVANNQAYRVALGHYFDLLKNDTVVPAQRDSLQAILTKLQNERVDVTFQHFTDLKNLCTAEQRPSFNELLPNLLQVMLPPKRPNR